MTINVEEIKKAYYLDKSSNEAILKKFGLLREETLASKERIYERFPLHFHDSLYCEYCDTKLVSKYVGKSAETAIPKFNLTISTTPPSRVKSDTQFWVSRQKEKAILTDEGYRISFPFCPLCSHKPLAFCNCNNCLKIKCLNREEIIARISSSLDTNEISSLENLSIKDCLNLSLTVLKLRPIELEAENHLLSLDNLLVPEDLSNLIATGVLIPDPTALINSLWMIDTYHYSGVNNVNQYYIKQSPKEILSSLDTRSTSMVSDARYISEIVAEWTDLALDESINVLNHYCGIHSIDCLHTKSIISTIKRALLTSGLALTSRFIYSSVRSAANYLTETEQANRQGSGLIHRNLKFWLDDEKAKSYSVSPFSRKGDFLNEPEKVNIFSDMFLTPMSADYFLDPINTLSLSQKNRNQDRV